MIRNGRKIVVNSQNWFWRASRENLSLCQPQRKIRWIVPLHVLFNTTPDEIERAHWKRSTIFNVTPEMVAQAIKERDTE